MTGWTGTILRIDLGRNKVTKEPLSKELAHNYIGGRGKTEGDAEVSQEDRGFKEIVER